MNNFEVRGMNCSMTEDFVKFAEGIYEKDESLQKIRELELSGSPVYVQISELDSQIVGVCRKNSLTVIENEIKNADSVFAVPRTEEFGVWLAGIKREGYDGSLDDKLISTLQTIVDQLDIRDYYIIDRRKDFHYYGPVSITLVFDEYKANKNSRMDIDSFIKKFFGIDVEEDAVIQDISDYTKNPEYDGTVASVMRTYGKEESERKNVSVGIRSSDEHSEKLGMDVQNGAVRAQSGGFGSGREGSSSSSENREALGKIDDAREEKSVSNNINYMANTGDKSVKESNGMTYGSSNIALETETIIRNDSYKGLLRFDDYVTMNVLSTEIYKYVSAWRKHGGKEVVDIIQFSKQAEDQMNLCEGLNSLFMKAETVFVVRRKAKEAMLAEVNSYFGSDIGKATEVINRLGIQPTADASVVSAFDCYPDEQLALVLKDGYWFGSWIVEYRQVINKGIHEGYWKDKKEFFIEIARLESMREYL